jgi:hypothetical protein
MKEKAVKSSFGGVLIVILQYGRTTKHLAGGGASENACPLMGL